MNQMRWEKIQNFTGIFTFYQSEMTNLWPPFFMKSFLTKLPKYVEKIQLEFI